MEERPIIFSTEMVKAILDGRKTQTRRVVKPQPKIVHALYADGTIETEQLFRSGKRIKCPYGQVGDRLWVREKYFMGSMTPCLQAYITFTDTTTIEPFVPINAHIQQRGWHPSLHLPKWASRITLELTEVRVERVQEISTKDAIHEGIFHDPYLSDYLQPIRDFQYLWDSINAKRGYGWHRNNWVWVIGFKLT